MRRAILAVGVVVAAGLPAPAADPPRVDPAAVDRLAAEALRRWDVPGVAVVVVRGTEVAHLKGYGVKRAGAPDPVGPDTLFPLASCSKAFTAALVGMLADDGRMGLDDPVRKHLPGFRLADPPADALVTVRDLLAHRTGVEGHDYLWYRAPWDLDDTLRRTTRLPATVPFRAGYSYSSLMYLAAGRAAAAAGGAPWDRLVRNRICTPLGMAGVAFTRDEVAAAADRAGGHRRTPTGAVEPMPAYPLGEPNPAGAVHATARDLGAWLRFQLSDGAVDGKRLISAKALAETKLPQTVMRRDDPAIGPVYPDSHQVSYGLGWVVYDHRGHKVVAHGGVLDGFRAQVTLLPDAGVGFALLNNLHQTKMNVALGNALVDEVLGLPAKDWHAYYRKLEADELAVKRDELTARDRRRVPGTRPSVPVDLLEGEYAHPAYGTAAVRIAGGRLEFVWSSFRGPLDHYQGDAWRVTEGEFADQLVEFRVRDGRPDAVRAVGVVFERK